MMSGMADTVESYPLVCSCCLRMCKDESQGAEGPPSSPPSAALWGGGIEKKENWFDRQLLNLDALFWNTGYVCQGRCLYFF